MTQITFNNTKTCENLLQEAIKNDFVSFLEKSFYTVCPGQVFLHNWHIDAIADRLKNIESGKIKRLIITMPPRYLKSLCISVAWPMWLLSRNAANKIIVASYSNKLSIKHSEDSRLIIESEWYKSYFPDIQIAHGRNEKSKFYTTKNGFRFATSVEGSLTGEGGDFLIADDPINPRQTNSKSYLKNNIEWFKQTFSSRLNNKKKGAIIIVMQRLHENDLVGYLLSKHSHTWHVLNLPIISNEDSYINFANHNYYRKKGELLHSEREGKEEIAIIKRDLGKHAFAAQYQQSPLPENNIIQRKLFTYYHTKDIDINNSSIIQSWDTACSTNDHSDYSACTTWLQINNNHYLLYATRVKLSYEDLLEKIIYLYYHWRSSALLIENKSSGQQLIQSLTKKHPNIIVHNILPQANKVSRLYKVLPMFEKGQVLFPYEKEWLPDFEEELLRFPKVKHDDQVDSVSQYLNWTNIDNNHIHYDRNFNLREL